MIKQEQFKIVLRWTNNHFVVSGKQHRLINNSTYKNIIHFAVHSVVEDKESYQYLHYWRVA